MKPYTQTQICFLFMLNKMRKGDRSFTPAGPFIGEVQIDDDWYFVSHKAPARLQSYTKMNQTLWKCRKSKHEQALHITPSGFAHKFAVVI